MTIANIAPIVGHEWTEVLIMKLIDADALLRALPDDLPYKGSVRRVLMQAETVDAEPVVRCKDCQHLYGSMGAACGLLLRRPDEFCSRGERREGKSCE